MSFEDSVKVLATFVPAIVTFYIGKWTIKKNQLLDIQKKRLYDAYLPLFRIIEPDLYKEVSDEKYSEILYKMLKIIDKHYELIDPYVVYQTRRIKQDLENGQFKYDSFEDLCIEIDNEFERMRKALNLPRRSFIFKAQWGHVKTSTRHTLGEILKTITSGIAIIFVGLIAYALKELIVFIFKLFSSVSLPF
ncbi:hypothetical protein [Bacillus cereus]|uniref:hypothetical protein n=1 Tax=Bacillus cereus TaxID=1396 RepID=UPI000BECF333|nr:hypothetical protein [Bacillus cereus]PEE49763.1 hypothetical protein COM80_29015 [Bacillus cereus]PFV63331.1 hypothetical protein COL16_28860 [Bacillus cereus]PGY64364.1 hypothetical protein COE34_28345 [Bacillus cereus]